MQTLLVVVGAAYAAATFTFAQAQSGAVNDPYTLDLLRRTLEQQKKHPGAVIRSPDAVPATTNRPTPAAPTKSPEVAVLERDYLEGKITARQFQKALEQALERQYQRERGSAPRTNAPANPKAAVVPAASPKAAAASGVKTTASTPAFTSPPPQPNPNQRKLSEVEMKLDEMLRKKAEREKAARDAATTAAQPPGIPLTKRQRLDALLKQVVEGKLTDADYKAQREKIAAEPD